MKEQRLYRGKRKDNGKWTYGYLFVIWERHCILWGTSNGMPNMIEVIPETVGQAVGLTDANTKVIYEDDILGRKNYWSLVVENQRIMPLNSVQYNNSKGTAIHTFDSSIWEIIGNIHDNPELLNE